MSSVNIFNTGKSGLFASRSALATTGHNISNVNTEGYSRQRVEQVSAPPAQIGNTVYGTGTWVKNVHRINDEYLTRQIGNEMKLMGQYEETDIALSQAEAVFNEIGNAGMNRLIAKFFNEFRKLGNEPESEALRATVRESSEQLIGDFKRISRNIREIQKNIDTRIDANVRQANELVQRIAKINEEIKRYEVKGGQAADLRDARDVAVKKLSNIIDVGVATNEKGEFTISVAGIGPLVSGSLFNKIYTQSAKANDETGQPENSLNIYLENLVSPNITHKLKTGKLGGLVDTRDKLLGGAMKRIDELAFTFASKINQIHREGYNISGGTGVNFFKEPEKINQAAELIQLSDQVRKDANNIATALAPDSPGDNRLVQFIAKLQHAKVVGNGSSTLDDYYNATVADLATVTQKNKQVLEHQGYIIGQLEKFRESVSGVSLDEETTNLVQFQHAFDASAKVIKVADEMLDTVLSIRR
ncbi:MAG: flagellar hook-associated protein FlgK [Bdellovibrionota bacterium]